MVFADNVLIVSLLNRFHYYHAYRKKKHHNSVMPYKIREKPFKFLIRNS